LETPQALVLTAWALFGLVVGSFLNVVIHRLPLEGESVLRPLRSRCPSCRRELTAADNIPLLSWILLRGRCRTCRWPIPVRYPLIELSNALLWLLAGALAPSVPMALVWVTVLSGLLVATAVDFDRFEIPDEVSIGGMVLAPLAVLLVPALHADTALAQALSGDGPVDRTGALVACLAGEAAGAGVLLGIGWLGKRLFQRDAMGLGDVKLLAAGGGFIGPGGALIALFLGSIAASLVGALNLLRFLCLSRARARARGVAKPFGRSLASARIAGRYLPFGPYLGLGIGIVLVDWEDVFRLVRENVFH
jgi:leader peptidase (prepilin peptidase)/N-methyltransferase